MIHVEEFSRSGNKLVISGNWTVKTTHPLFSFRMEIVEDRETGIIST